MPGPSARQAYFDRDQREIGDLMKTVPDLLRPFYLQVGVDTSRPYLGPCTSLVCDGLCQTAFLHASHGTCTCSDGAEQAVSVPGKGSSG